MISNWNGGNTRFASRKHRTLDVLAVRVFACLHSFVILQNMQIDASQQGSEKALRRQSNVGISELCADRATAADKVTRDAFTEHDLILIYKFCTQTYTLYAVQAPLRKTTTTTERKSNTIATGKTTTKKQINQSCDKARRRAAHADRLI